MKQIIVLAHNIRSTHNVGSIFRTAEGFGIDKIILSGYTPAPKFDNDTRLPHIVDKLNKQIHKTALGAETMVDFSISDNIKKTIEELKQQHFTIIALEQVEKSIMLPDFKPSKYRKIALLLGEEVHGITDDLLTLCDEFIEIPMFGKKESFNVSVASGIALYKIACE